MKDWSIDLHLHTILSPCGSDEMLPESVLKRAIALGLDAIAITDHNTSQNVAAFMTKGEELGIKVIPGMELQTQEDVHIVCLFNSLEEVMVWQDFVYQHLPPLKNNKKSFGEQWIVNAEGNKIEDLDRMLLVGTDLTIEEAVKEIHRIGGLAIAAHIDRQAFSLWGHLGHIPLDLNLDGVELTPHLPRIQPQMDYLKEHNITHVVSSDAHYLQDMRAPHSFAYMEECTIKELKMAFAGENGRILRTLR